MAGTVANPSSGIVSMMGMKLEKRREYVNHHIIYNCMSSLRCWRHVSVVSFTVGSHFSYWHDSDSGRNPRFNNWKGISNLSLLYIWMRSMPPLHPAVDWYWGRGDTYRYQTRQGKLPLSVPVQSNRRKGNHPHHNKKKAKANDSRSLFR